MNQNPEQIARDHIDRLLTECGWLVQPKSKLNLAAGMGVAVTEYRNSLGRHSKYKPNITTCGLDDF